MGARVRGVLAVALFPAVAFACGASESRDDGTDPRITAFIADYCDAQMPCCAEAALSTDGVACRTLLDETFASGDFGFDAAAANECSAWLETVNGTGLCKGTAAVPLACGSVFSPQGDGAPGDRCDSAGDCALSTEGGVRCVGSASQDSCQLVIEGTEGSTPCGWTVFSSGTSVSSSNLDEPRVYSCALADGLRCDGNVCVRIVPEGGACVDSEECAEGTFCSLAGTCLTKTPTGGLCDFSDECAGGVCENGRCAEEADTWLTFLCGTNES
jgi:hypothetical protein